MSTLNMHATILGKPVSCLHNWRASKAWPVSCTAPVARLRASCSVQQEVRRSGNYQPTRWDFSYIQSFNSPYDKVYHYPQIANLINTLFIAGKNYTYSYIIYRRRST